MLGCFYGLFLNTECYTYVRLSCQKLYNISYLVVPEGSVPICMIIHTHDTEQEIQVAVAPIGN